MARVEVSNDVLEPRTASWSLNPLTHLSSLWTGTSYKHAISCEEALLKRFVKTSFRLGRVAVKLNHLGLGKQFINTLELNADVDSRTPPVVWLHGAGAGLGLGYRNFDTIANLGGIRRRVLGFDWLGMAGSSRPPFPYGGFRQPAWSLRTDDQIDAAIHFYVDSLEAWREAMGIEQFDLVAHSIGGYLATQYAMRHPSRVRRLVLVSPVGWADKPQGELAKGRAGGLFGFLWDTGLGNFGFLRILGRGASGLAKRAIVGRFGIRNEEEMALVSNYFWSQLTAQPISAEVAVNYLLEPYFAPAPFGFYAKRPVCKEPRERLADLPPTVLLYGSHDLHYIPTMPQAVKAVAATSANPVSMHYVRHSDHHLYIDNPEEFHLHLEKALQLDVP